MRFGVDAAQHQLTWDELVERARWAEQVGFEGLWLFDHFKALYGDPSGPCLEAWTLLAALAAKTERIRLGTLVTGMTHRLPSILAIQALTVDHVSGGRVELAVGAAWNESEHRELGIPFPPTSERIDRFEEGVQILRLLLTEDEVTFGGEHYTLDKATVRPRPLQLPHPPLWIGGSGRRRMLPLAGRHADVWHGWADSAEELREMNEIIDRAAEQAGRDPADIARSTNLSLSQPIDDIRREFDGYREGRISYLILSWPSEGASRVEEVYSALSA